MKVKIIEVGLSALFLIFSLFATIGVSAVTTASPKVYIDPALTENLCPGDTFTVTVKVDSDTYELRAVKLDLVYDTTKFKVNSATVEDDLFGADNYLDLSDLTDDGELNIAIARKGTIHTPESGTLITVEFQVKDGVPDGTYALDLQDVVLKDEDNNNIPGVSVTDGEVVVNCSATPHQEYQESVEVYLDPALVENLCPGDTFTVNILVDSGEYNLRAVSLDLGYDPNVLQVNGITESQDLFGTSYLTEPGSGDDGAGTIHYGMASTEDIYTPSSGTFITVEFEVKAGAADGNYPLDLMNVVLKDENNNDIPGVSVTDGTVVVQCTTPPACPDADFVLHLKAGWNLVSIPKPITPTNAVTLFNLSWPETAYYYDASSGEWINDNNIMVKPCQAYWVYKTKDEDICIYYDRSTLLPPSQQLYIGWNMIGHIDDTAWSIEDFLSVTGLENKCSIVCTVDHQGMPHDNLKLKCYYITAPRLSEFNTILPGWGYWVFLKENVLMPGTAP